MSYLAIARKWRPQRFEDVVGQVHVTRTLQNAIRLGRVHHAFLFTGARGVGKTSCARLLAKALNCENGPSPEPCGTCSSCTEISSGASVDVMEIDGASNNGVDEVRSLRDNVRYLPSRSRKKVYVIDEVHMLTSAAFNALLKTLEEPPEHVVFIFATTEPQKIPDTIQSRCLRFDFKRIPVRAIVDLLTRIAEGEGLKISPSSLRLIAREAEGSMRDSQSLLDQVISFAGTEVSDAELVEILGLIDRALIYELLGGLVGGDGEACLAVVERVFSFGYDLGQLARDLLEAMRNLNVVKVANNAHRFLDVPEDELAQLSALAERVSADALSRMFGILMDAYEAIHRSESPRYRLEMVLLRMAQVRPVEGVQALLGRLASLEGQLLASGGGAPALPQPRRSEERPPEPQEPPRGGGGRSQARPRAGGGWNAPAQQPSQGRSKKSWGAEEPVAKAEPEPPPAALDYEPPPPGGPIGQPGKGRSWRDFLAQLDRRNPRYQTLIHGVPLREGPGALELAFPAEKPVLLEAARRYAADATVLDYLTRFYGGYMKMTVVPRDAEERQALPEQSLAEEQASHRRARKRELAETLREQPLVAAAQRIFEVPDPDVQVSVKLAEKSRE